MADTQSKGEQRSRHDRVRQTLNDAQGDNIPDYQGYRAFWLLPIEEFLQVVIYGQRMIAEPEVGDVRGTVAPGEKAHCGNCGSAESQEPDEEEPDQNCWPTAGNGPGKPTGKKRSDRSGLIKGLRGEYPFDGSVFPPLLWNAARKVTDAEIAFIADWIDDGCPTSDAEDETPKVAVKENEQLSLACGDRAHKCSDKHINAIRKETWGPNVRKDARCMNDDELRPLRQALACMFQYNEYWMDERSFHFWARIHTNSCQHGWEQFLPWHRLYLYFFEQTLQDYDERITLPYWSWTDYSEQNKDTNQTLELDRGIIPSAYRCWITKRGIDRLKDTKLFTEKEIGGLEKIQDRRYNSGLRFLTAAGMKYELVKDPQSGQARWSPKLRALYDELKRINALWLANRWPGSIGQATHYPTRQNVKSILDVKTYAAFGSGPSDDHHFGALEEVHNGMHNFSGGANPHYPPPKELGIENPDQQNPENPPAGWMTDNRVTAFDPIFWAHHANVDRLWSIWQEQTPGVNPEELDGILPPWSLTVRDTLSIKKLGYEYMKDSYYYATNNSVALTRFNSQKPGVQSRVLDEHRKAEVRLHRVQRGNKPNVHIRVFLNAPDANAGTSMENNENFVGQVSTFHGSCYGGPGHCAVPPPRTRRFDHRPLHHHEPRNFRLDATEAVQGMIAKGEDDISVHLVVVGIDGKPLDKALFIDGVSLNFLD